MKTSRGVAAFVGVRELVCKLLRFYDKPTCDVITRFAKEDHADRHGLDAIPREFLRRERGKARGKARLEYSTSIRSMVFFRNLLALSAILPPRVVASLARKEVNATQLSKQLAKARKLIEHRADTDQRWLSGWDALAARLIEGIDLAAAPILDQNAAAVYRGGRAAAPLDIYLLHRLEEVEKRSTRSDDASRIEAEKALYLLGLGELDLAEAMLENALALAPTHAFCNYAAAVVVIARTHRRISDANRFSLEAQEAYELSHETYWQDLAGGAGGDVLSLRRRALACLVRAYEHWPQHKEDRYTYFVDHQQRDHAITMAADIAFQLSHDHGSVEFSTFDRIKARRRGEPLEWFFAADVDPVLLALLREYEAHGPSPHDWRRSRFELATLILQLYFVLSPTDYARYLVGWKETLERALVRDVEPYLLEMGYPNPTAKVVREHVQRSMTEDERTEILLSLKQRHNADTERFYGQVATFLVDDGTEAPDEWDE
jgi:tetratricopeptide (TPR) repeat protein